MPKFIKEWIVLIACCCGIAVFVGASAFLGWSMSESAAWVQAIGSLIGLGIAIYIPWRSQLDAKEQAKKSVFAVAMIQVGSLRSLLKVVRANRPSDLESVAFHVDQGIRVGRTVNFELLPIAWLPNTMAVLVIAEEASKWIQENRQRTEFDYSSEAYCQRILADLERYVEALFPREMVD